MTKDPATLMVGQYFKRKRDIMEIVLTSATGLGLSSMAAFIMLSARYIVCHFHLFTARVTAGCCKK